MATEIIILFDISTTFTPNSIDYPQNGKLCFGKEVAVGEALSKIWSENNIGGTFPYCKNQDFLVKTVKAIRYLSPNRITLELQKNWQLVVDLDIVNKATAYCLCFAMPTCAKLKFLPGFTQKLSHPIKANLSLYFATEAIQVEEQNLTKGISFNGYTCINNTKYSFSKIYNVEPPQSIEVIPIDENIGQNIHINSCTAIYKSTDDTCKSKNWLSFQFDIEELTLEIMDNVILQRIRLGFIFNRLNKSTIYSLNDNLILEVDLKLSLSTPPKNISLEPLPWKKTISFPKTFRCPLPDGIPFSKDNIKQMSIITDSSKVASHIPDETNLKRLIYNWQLRYMEAAVEVTIPNDFPLKKYSQVFTLNKVAVYINPEQN